MLAALSEVSHDANGVIECGGIIRQLSRACVHPVRGLGRYCTRVGVQSCANRG